MQKLILLLVLVSLFFVGCSCEKQLTKNVEKDREAEEAIQTGLNVEFNEVYSWVNLMPGPKAQPKFSITGEIELNESEMYSLSEMELSQIKIYQNGEEIYNIKPIIREDSNLSRDGMRFLIFSTSEGLLIKNILDIEKSVDAKFIFEDELNKYSEIVNNIKIDKAY